MSIVSPAVQVTSGSGMKTAQSVHHAAYFLLFSLRCFYLQFLRRAYPDRHKSRDGYLCRTWLQVPHVENFAEYFTSITSTPVRLKCPSLQTDLEWVESDSIKPAIITDLLRVHEYDYLQHIQVPSQAQPASNHHPLLQMKKFTSVRDQIHAPSAHLPLVHPP